ncbi:MAG TPA: hypothetical protein VGX75_03615 [bacterium]|nr:hypothetical protein [bacterium]
MRTTGIGRTAARILVPALLAAFIVGPGLAQRASAQPGAYTGLVIVARTIHLDRSISPAVLTPSGEVVYGRGWWKPGQLNDDFAARYGIVEYAPSLETASRAGPRPLLVFAIGVSGPVLSNFKTDVVVSDEDALRIRDANRRSRFLQQMRVAFVNQPMAYRLRYQAIADLGAF